MMIALSMIVTGIMILKLLAPFIPSPFFSGLTEDLFNPSYNFCIPKRIGTINIEAIFSLWVLLATIVAKIMDALISGHNKKPRQDLALLMTPVSFAAFFLYLALQTTSQWNTFCRYLKAPSSISTPNQLTTIFGRNYLVPQFAKRIIAEKRQCALLTGRKNPEESNALLTFITMRYYLYPIKVTNAIMENTTCLIIMTEGSALPSVPNNFNIISRFDEKTFIAEKKDL